MKRGTCFILPVTFDVDLDDVQQIEFMFKQGIVSMNMTYPSQDVVRVENTNTVNIVWTREMTYRFNANKDIGMDTRITLKDIDTNPETKILVFNLERTLFPAQEVTA